MSKSTITLAGLTAVQIRELLASKAVTKATVVAYLTEKEAKTGLRYPAKKLLGELTGETPAPKPEAKPAAPAPEAKPAAPAPETNVLADLLTQVRVLTERIAALEGVKVEKPEPVAAKPVAAKPEPVKAAPKPEPVKAAPKPEPVKAKPAPAKPEAKPAPAKPEAKPAPAPVVENDAMTEAEAREEFASLKLAQLRDIADFDTTGMSKTEIIDEMVAQAIEEGVVVAAPAKAQGKPDLKVLARDIAVEF